MGYQAVRGAVRLLMLVVQLVVQVVRVHQDKVMRVAQHMLVVIRMAVAVVAVLVLLVLMLQVAVEVMVVLVLRPAFLEHQPIMLAVAVVAVELEVLLVV